MNPALFRDVLRSEWTKLRSVRSTYWSLLIAAIVGIGLSTLVSAATAHAYNSGHFSVHDKLTFDATSTSLVGLFFAQLALGVFAVIVMSSEYSTGTVRTTMAAVPQRGYVLAAKAVLVAAISTVLAEGIGFGGYLIGQSIYRSQHVPKATSLSDPGVLRAVIGAGLSVAILTLFALGLATILRHTAAGVATLVGTMFVLPLVFGPLPDSWQQNFVRYLPAEAGGAITTVIPTDGVLRPWVGFGVFAGWAGLLLAIGWYMLRTRDV